eukprot:snap_masked-scaffold_12-processed-gene-12.37-mRNA-1 protein AED:1.00 eAED:1.00 QI:0/0/0/0/1/1/2/0/59
MDTSIKDVLKVKELIEKFLSALSVSFTESIMVTTFRFFLLGALGASYFCLSGVCKNGLK